MKKKSIINLLLIAVLGVVLTLNACGNKSNNSTKTEQTQKQGKEYSSEYICPMHCEGSGSDTMGQCPVCGMDYVKNEEHDADGHQHGDHGHMHE